MQISSYAKSITYIVLAGVLVFQNALADGVVSNLEWVQIAIAVLGAIPVYYFGNKASGVFKYTKLYVTLIVAALSALATVLAGSISGFASITPGDWISVAIAGLAAIGVYIVPNAPVVTPAAKRKSL